MPSPLRFAVCGTTERTVQCANALAAHSGFELVWGVCPTPRIVGRKKVLSPSPLEEWLRTHNVPIHHVEKSLRPIRQELEQETPIDFLLVVDFGYLVPEWLIALPKIAPINVHPSDLPKYRGSSPGQFALLYGEKDSAVAIMRLTAGLDEGPIIQALEFSVVPQETQESYYSKAFDLAAAALPETLLQYAQDRAEKPQPEKSTTPIAKRFSRQDGYIPYSLIKQAMREYVIPSDNEKMLLSPLFQELLVLQPQLDLGSLLERATRALHPWPGIWTLVPTYNGKENIRLKILEAKLQAGQFRPIRWQYEGESAQNGTLHL